MTKLAPSPGSARFLYRSVSQELRNRIVSGRYAPNTRIPSVSELAKEFGVSTITIRRSLRDLSLEGLLVGRQGLGVFVAYKRHIVRSLTPTRLAPLEEDIRRAGFEPGIRDIDIVLVSNDDDPALRSLVRPHATAYRLDRVLLASGEPVGLDTMWLPRRLGDLLKPRLRGHFVISQLEEHGILVDHIDYKFEAATASEEQASHLQVVPGSPLLVSRLTPFGPDGAPLLATRTITRADRLSYEFSGRPKGRRPKAGVR